MKKEIKLQLKVDDMYYTITQSVDEKKLKYINKNAKIALEVMLSGLVIGSKENP